MGPAALPQNHSEATGRHQHCIVRIQRCERGGWIVVINKEGSILQHLLVHNDIGFYICEEEDAFAFSAFAVMHRRPAIGTHTGSPGDGICERALAYSEVDFRGEWRGGIIERILICRECIEAIVASVVLEVPEESYGHRACQLSEDRDG